MRDFGGSTLWRVSRFEREQPALDERYADTRPTLLPTTLLAELRQLEAEAPDPDLLEMAAACLRHRQPVLMVLKVTKVTKVTKVMKSQAGDSDALAWPLSMFPHERLVHSPGDFAAHAMSEGLAGIRLLDLRRPIVRPPGHPQQARVAALPHYRPLGPVLWALALHGPRHRLLRAISGRAAYRLAPAPEPVVMSGALAPAVQRLRKETVALRDIARWPGLDTERAARLVNALYLTDALIVSRSHPAARDEPASGPR